MPKEALIVVDLQKDYLTSGRWPLVGIDHAVETAKRVIAYGHLDVKVRHEYDIPNPPSSRAAPTGRRTSTASSRAGTIWRS